jgi:hypothetical protein
MAAISKALNTLASTLLLMRETRVCPECGCNTLIDVDGALVCFDCDFPTERCEGGCTL